MRSTLVSGVVFAFSLLFALAFYAAADFTLVGTIPSPAGTHLTGLDNADGVLFAVAAYDGEESCLFLIDPADGDVLNYACVTHEPPGCDEVPPQYVSCAFQPWNTSMDDPLCLDTYWVGDACGDLIKYSWTEPFGLVYAGHCQPQGMGEPAGLTVCGDYPYVLDRTNRVVFKLRSCFDAPCNPCYIPGAITNPSALTAYQGHFFISDEGTDLVYEIDHDCGLVDVHSLEDFAPRMVSGMAFIGDLLYVASDDDEILIYRFGAPGWEVPEGEDVVVEPLPDELEITFPSVSGAGSLYVHVSDTDPCPAPAGVRFLPEFYEIMTTASFDYVAQVAILTEDPMPEGINPRLVRIFRRPSGACMPYMDVTVAPLQIVETVRDPRLARLSKSFSEDDEFSVFILAEDMRNPMDVVNLKFMYLEEAIEALEGTPVDPYNLMNALLADAMAEKVAHRFARAAELVDRIADVAMAEPEIPHTYDPDDPGTNLGGSIVARAHTLSFSLRWLVEEKKLIGPPGAPLRAMAQPNDLLTLSPNPSTDGFTIGFSPASGSPVTLRVYGVDGRVVRTLVEDVSPGAHETVTWDGRNDAGMRVAVGTYFAVLSQGEYIAVEKLILK
jgi:hypothetical protein